MNKEITQIHHITLDVNGDFPGSDKPSPLEVILPSTQIFHLTSDNKYYLNVKNNYLIYATIHDMNGIIIDLIDDRDSIILTKENKKIKTSIYALNLEINSLRGTLKYIINNEETEIISDQRVFGAFKLIYYPPHNMFNLKEQFGFRVYLRNYSVASEYCNFEINICKENCTCVDLGSCKGCVDGYAFFDTSINDCNAGKDLCRNKFYKNENDFVNCTDECPSNYPFYNENTKECRKNISNTFHNTTDYPTQRPTYQTDSQTNSQTNAQTESHTESQTETHTETKTESQTESHTESQTQTHTESQTQTQTESHTESQTEHGKENNNVETTSFMEDTNENGNKNYETTSTQYNENMEKIMEWFLNSVNSTGMGEIDIINEPEIIYSALSSLIKDGVISISPGEEDITLKGNNVIYQLSNSDNQKNANPQLEISIIDLGECEKIIKKRISYEDDPTPLLILKVDIKKEGIKSPLVAYEVYNPYTKEKINLDICENSKINISAPVYLSSDEMKLYDDLLKQGYDLYDANNSFYQDICTQYTSENGTDVILIDRKNYYYDEKATFCENSCNYQGINLNYKKVNCYCQVKDNSMDFDSNNFDKNKFLGNFYKVEDYTNYQVLYCYKLVFSSKGLKNNICFYILNILLLLYILSMIGNLLKALKKIDEIIFKIFQDKFMYEIMKNIFTNKKNKNNEEKKEELNENNTNKNESKDQPNEEAPKKISFFQKVLLRSKNRKAKANDNNNNDNNNKNDNNNDNNKNDNNSDNKNDNKNEKNEIYEISDNIIRSRTNNSSFHQKNIKKRDDSKKYNTLSINNKNNIKMRMNHKIDYSNNVRERIFRYPNLFDEIINIDKKKNSTKILNITENFSNMNNISNNTSNKNEKGKSFMNTNSSNKELLNKNNLKKSCNIQYYNRKHYNLNNIFNEINPNPPLRRNNLYSNNKYSNQQGICLISDSTEKNTLSKGTDSLIGVNSKRKNNKIVSFNVEDTLTKKKFLQKTSIMEEKKMEKKDNIMDTKNDNPDNKKNKNETFIDEELNKMDYENALINDKRTFWQYYLSLLKKKHLIFLVFISNDDYNVFLLKFSLFVVSVSLFFALNTLFFRDSTMRQIFINEGRYNLLYQIPQVLYSTIISSIMTFILKNLSLSQMTIIEIKKEYNKTKAKTMANDAKKCLKIKLYFFCFIGLSIIIFCWYYVTAFGAVYTNTQMHLIKDTLISFGISMLYPFVVNIIPGILRIQALKAEKKDKENLYKASIIFSYI